MEQPTTTILKLLKIGEEIKALSTESRKLRKGLTELFTSQDDAPKTFLMSPDFAVRVSPAKTAKEENETKVIDVNLEVIHFTK